MVATKTGSGLAVLVVLGLALGIASGGAAGASPVGGNGVDAPQDVRVDEGLDRLAERLDAGSAPIRVVVELDPASALGDLPAGASADMVDEARVAAAQDDLVSALDGTGTEVLRRYTSLPAVALEVDAAGIDVLRDQAGVRSVQEDEVRAPTLASSIPVIQGDLAHDGGWNGAGTTVAILDTGVEKAHPVFGSRVVAEACFTDSDCPNGQSTQVGAGAGAPCLLSVCSHGTHVAGIAAGAGTNPGVAPAAQIISIQVFTSFGAGVGAYDADLLAALDWLYSQRLTYTIVSANMSLGGGLYSSNCDAEEPSFKTMLDKLAGAGIATVVAAGNDGQTNQISGPACISTAVAVGSTTDDDEVSYFSNVSDDVDLFAPGSSITSAVPGGAFGTKNGTSMATPHVAGAFALVRQKFPGDSVASALGRLDASGLPVTDTRSGGTVTKPRIQLADALGFVPGPPTNDDLADATSFNPVVGGTLPGRNALATFEAGEPTHGGVVGGKSVWWTFTAPAKGELVITTQGSSFDTVLAAYTGDTLPGLVPVAANDDSPSGTWSTLTLAVERDDVIRLAVDGKAGAEGTIKLPLVWTSLEPPDNDDLADAIPMTPSTASPVVGTNEAATLEAGEPMHAGVSGGKSVWWSFTAPTVGILDVTTQYSTFDTVLAAYTGDSMVTLDEVASNDEALGGAESWSQITFGAQPDTPYRIAVAGRFAQQGAIKLSFTWTPTVPPTNDAFSAAAPVTIEGGPVVGTTQNATKQIGEPVHAGVAGGRSVWWSFTAPEVGVLQLDTAGSAIDTLLAVYTGSAVNGLSPVASNDDADVGMTSSRTYFTAAAGTTYRIAVDGNDGAQGPVTLTPTWTVGAGERFNPLSPFRILDSREGIGTVKAPWSEGQTRSFAVAGVGGVPTTATTVVMNVTVTGPTETSHLTVFPDGALKPDASNLNFEPNQTIPNLVTVKVGTAGRVQIYNNSGNVEVIADIVGFYGLSGDRFTGMVPTRVLDTREHIGGYNDPWGEGMVRTVAIAGVAGIPSDATAVVLNVTVTAPTKTSHLTIYPGGTGITPTASNLNFSAGQTIPNLVVVKLGPGGTVSIRNNSGNVHVIADVVGYLTP